MQLHIQLGKHIGIKDARFRNVPDRCGLHYVSNDEFLNGLVLGHASGTVSAANRLHMAAALFGTTVVPSFLCHFGRTDRRAGDNFSFVLWQRFCSECSLSPLFFMLPASFCLRVYLYTFCACFLILHNFKGVESFLGLYFQLFILGSCRGWARPYSRPSGIFCRTQSFLCEPELPLPLSSWWGELWGPLPCVLSASPWRDLCPIAITFGSLFSYLEAWVLVNTSFNKNWPHAFPFPFFLILLIACG